MECDLSESDMNEHQTISFKAFQDYLKFRPKLYLEAFAR